MEKTVKAFYDTIEAIRKPRKDKQTRSSDSSSTKKSTAKNENNKRTQFKTVKNDRSRSSSTEKQTKRVKPSTSESATSRSYSQNTTSSNSGKPSYGTTADALIALGDSLGQTSNDIDKYFKDRAARRKRRAIKERNFQSGVELAENIKEFRDELGYPTCPDIDKPYSGYLDFTKPRKLPTLEEAKRDGIYIYPTPENIKYTTASNNSNFMPFQKDYSVNSLETITRREIKNGNLIQISSSSHSDGASHITTSIHTCPK